MPRFVRRKPRAKKSDTVSSAKPDRATSQPTHDHNPPGVLGNQAMLRLLQSKGIQPKLTVNQPGDRYEQEADRVADTVMRMPESQMQRQPAEEEEETVQTKRLSDGITPLFQRQPAEEEEEESVQTKSLSDSMDPQIQRQPAGEEEEESVQAKANSDQRPKATPELASHLNAVRGGGQPLPESTRVFFEPRFGHDFSGVQVHADGSAAQMAKAVNAQAFTVGQDVVFGAGQYSPDTSGGKRLLAHELVHTIQQTNAGKVGDVSRGVLQRTIGDGHDLKSPRFAGDEVLEACFDDERYLKFGAQGPAVIKLQLALIDDQIQLPTFGVDGVFGAETHTAVIKFQKKHGLKGKDVDGIVGPVTMGLLDKRFPPVPDSPHSQPTQVPAEKKTVTVNVTSLSGNTKSLSNSFKVANVLFKQANIEVRLGKFLRLDKHETKKRIGADLALDEHFFPAAPTNDEKELFKVNQSTDAVSAYFVKGITLEFNPNLSGNHGYAIRPRDKMGFVGIAISNEADDKTMAHELGHILTDAGHAPLIKPALVLDPNALMDVGARGTKLSAAEIEKMRKSPFAK